MYRKIEKEYKKSDLESNFFKVYKIFAIVVSFFMTIFSFFGVSDNIIFFMIIVASFSFILLYRYNDYKKYITLKEKKKNLKEKKEIYFNRSKQKKIDNFIGILKNENITNKDELALIINYYNRTKPLTINKSFSEQILTATITIISFVVVFIDSRSKTINYAKMLLVSNSIVKILIFSLVGYLIIKVMGSTSKSKQSIYAELEELSTYIYVNYDDYEKLLKEAK